MMSISKKTKEVLKAIQSDAAKRKTYYVILDSYTPWLHNTSTFCEKLGGDADMWKDVCILEKRYRRFVHYIREVKPQWKEVDRIHWADNSVDIVQENANGETRKVIASVPSGDVCF
jgi:hypothetical protein